MKLRESLVTAAFLLNLKEVRDTLEAKEEKYDTESTDAIRMLTDCANLVISEIAADYFPIMLKEKITVADKKFDYSALRYAPIDIYTVKKDGVTADFKLYPSYAEVSCDGGFEVEYSMLPPKIGIDDAVPYTSDKINDRNLAYGIACEYCLLNGLNDEAVMFDKRFRDSMHKSAIQRNERRIRPRAWL